MKLTSATLEINNKIVVLKADILDVRVIINSQMSGVKFPRATINNEGRDALRNELIVVATDIWGYRKKGPLLPNCTDSDLYDFFCYIERLA